MENKLTKFEISKHLNISRNRLNTLLKQLPPNKEKYLKTENEETIFDL